MIQNSKLVGFVLTGDPERAKQFYSGPLGLKFIQDDGFALVFDSGGNQIRIAKVDNAVQPARHTVLGWEVTDIEAAVRGLAAEGVVFERYPWCQQDDLGIWHTPGNAKVAWFKDPDGNVLSLSQH